jgi:phytoene desaturase (3,4-didehydrolycopene-forming)
MPTPIFYLMPQSPNNCRRSLHHAQAYLFTVSIDFLPLPFIKGLIGTGSLDRIIPELHTHNVFLADEYQDSFDDIFKRQQIPKEPSFYVNVPTRIDPSAAPPGKDSVVVLVPCGHLLEPDTTNLQDWEAMIARARSAVLETIKLRTGIDLEPALVAEAINSPTSWKEKFNLDKGAILGLSHSFFNVLSFRPATKHASIENLYFVGASTHPGTGVPIVLAGSKITTGQILEHLGVNKPWLPGGHKVRAVSGLDRQGYIPFGTETLVISLLCLMIALGAYYLQKMNDS